MIKWINKYFWKSIARGLIRGRVLVILAIIGITYAFSTQWKYNRMIFKERGLLPAEHPTNVEFQKFIDVFGEQGNMMVIAVKDSVIFQKKNFQAWNLLNQKLSAMSEFESVLSTENLKFLKKNSKEKKFNLKSLLEKYPNPNQYSDALKDSLPFYEGFIYNKNRTTIQSVLFMDKELVDTKVRSDFILKDFLPLVQKFEKDTGIRVRISGIPYIRTINANMMLSEIKLFVFLALFVTAFIFFLFFKSVRATFISVLIVLIGVMWGFGIMGVMRYEITALTALVPPLIIVIGLPNCIFLINKYQQEVSKHGNKIRSLVRTISRVGNATLMTNLTTAAGFATFIVTENSLLKEFGIIAALNIMGVFLLSITIIPSVYSFMPLPKRKHLKYLDKKWINTFIGYFKILVKKHRLKVYIASLSILIMGIIGLYKIKATGSILDDIPKNAKFSQDVDFFEQEFDGILPIEIIIDTKRKNGAMKVSNLKRLDRVHEFIKEMPELSKAMSIVNFLKYIKQAYYNGNPKYYELISNQEQGFILSYIKKGNNKIDLIKSFVDSTGQIIRFNTMMKAMDIDHMKTVRETLRRVLDKEFPKKHYDVHITGKSLAFAEGTEFLIKNLFTSLILAISIISLLMAYLFRSIRMIVISLIPNILPLVATAGMMGFLGIPLKPSTVLVFSIAFGISVDDTLHFLAKYRQELQLNNWKISRSVYKALRETGTSMFYTSVILFFGFSVFTISDFGGTVALGGLVSITLLLAMLSNLVLLPSLLISLERVISNKEILKNTQIEIISDDYKD